MDDLTLKNIRADGEVQTRNHSSELLYFNSIEEAQAHAENIDQTVWKISFTDVMGVRRRFVRTDTSEFPGWCWQEDPLTTSRKP